MNRIDVSLLRDYLEFCRYMNFTKTAEFLHITQPALSYRISALEKSLGVILVNRKQPVRLTRAGVQLFETMRPIITRLDDAVAEFEDAWQAQKPQDDSQISVKKPMMNKGSVYDMFHGLLNQFQSLNPTIEMNFLSNSKADFITEMNKGVIDCALTLAFDGDPEVIGKTIPEEVDLASNIDYLPIAEVPILVAVNKESPLAEKPMVSFADLAGYAIICIYESEYSEYLYALECNLKRYGLKNEIRPKLSNVRLTGVDKDEVFLTAPRYPVRGRYVLKELEERPTQLIHVAFNKSPRTEAVGLLRAFFENVQHAYAALPELLPAGLQE